MDEEKPTNQASLNSFVVPVLPPAGKRTPHRRAADAVPRSSTSVSIETIWYADCSEMTRSRTTALASASSPSPLRTDLMARGRTAYPPFGNTAKAVVSASGVTTPEPSDSDGTSGRSRMPAPEASRRKGREPMRC